MPDRREMEDRLAKLEALFRGGATAGERAAAGAAMERLQDRIDRETGRRGPEPGEEVQYTFPDTWSVRLFVAICRKHGVQPYRYPRQRRTTVMVKAPRTMFEVTVLEEFRVFQQALVRYFGETVDHLIADVMKGDGDDENLELRRITS